MSNLDSLFKSGDITLPTKVHLVKAVVFPMVMYDLVLCGPLLLSSIFPSIRELAHRRYIICPRL